MIERLNEFAQYCSETTGASFYFSKRKEGLWVVNFSNVGRLFESIDLLDALNKAETWLLATRKPVEVETKYTIFVKGVER